MPGPIRPKIVSGGQTGVDRAALDVALDLGLEAGGWVPRGRRAEDGVIAERYPVRECESDAYAERTRLNVRDSDATLVLTRGRPKAARRKPSVSPILWPGRSWWSTWTARRTRRRAAPGSTT